MNFRLCFLWFVVIILSLSPHVSSADKKGTERKCIAQCMDYCTNESESGIPPDLCNNACITMCYSARYDANNMDIDWEDDQ
ncbi:unnamed protein product [Rotaria sordida]|uniref:Uncharacterized protein n=1 Tax=Rotaria sordida TaxID=392033 RepID=A0A814A3Y4_9BILA|nr:unnamed protein product [Rotaria sordida]CAF0851273.1 unnamed protein product [Rotaria sordida]CAF0909106.1 unnamed protein product [Rotaria sordida]CAF0947651.1 unnamed protein product [Rotaria sordida]CAF1046160.1 unnamed protein product [Rotaria sordida]